MKVLPNDLATLKALVTPFDTPEIRAKYVAGDFPRADKVKDLNKRFRWDLLWMADGVRRREWIGRVYQYANDEHIDTALRSLIPTLRTA